MVGLESGDIRLIEWPTPAGWTATHRCLVLEVRAADARVSVMASSHDDPLWVSRGELYRGSEGL